MSAPKVRSRQREACVTQVQHRTAESTGAGWLVAMRALAGLALLRALRTLFGNRMALLLPLAVFLFTPIALTDLSWWAVGCQAVPVQLALAMAVDQHVRYIRTGRIRNVV